jgi:serine/threonine-protein phosphatase 6 regulatory subunit 3
LAHVIALNGSYRNDGNGVDEDGMGLDERDEIEPALDFPIRGACGAIGDEMLGLDDDDEGMTDSDEPGSSDDEVMEEIVMYDEPPSDVRLSPLPVRDDGGFLPSSLESGMGVGNMASFLSTTDVRDLESRTGQSTSKKDGVTLLRSSPDPSPTPPPGLTSHSSTTSSTSSLRRNPQNSRRRSGSRRRATMENSVESLMVAGEYMKRRLLDEGVLGMIVVSNSFYILYMSCFVV